MTALKIYQELSLHQADVDLAEDIITETTTTTKHHIHDELAHKLEDSREDNNNNNLSTTTITMIMLDLLPVQLLATLPDVHAISETTITTTNDFRTTETTEATTTPMTTDHLRPVATAANQASSLRQKLWDLVE